MMKRMLFTVLLISGLFITAAKADEFIVLDHVTFTGPFSEDTPIFAEFAIPASAKSLQLAVFYSNVIPDGCCAATRFVIKVSLEGKDPAGNWHTIIWDEEQFNNSLDQPIRVFMIGTSLAPLNGQVAHMGSGENEMLISYMFGRPPRNLRIKFSIRPEPFSPPRADDLVSFTVSVSGQAFID